MKTWKISSKWEPWNDLDSRGCTSMIYGYICIACGTYYGRYQWFPERYGRVAEWIQRVMYVVNRSKVWISLGLFAQVGRMDTVINCIILEIHQSAFTSRIRTCNWLLLWGIRTVFSLLFVATKFQSWFEIDETASQCPITFTKLWLFRLSRRENQLPRIFETRVHSSTPTIKLLSGKDHADQWSREGVAH